MPSGLLRPVSAAHGDPDITAITYDSRKAVPGSLFVAWRGEKTDGHHFIPEAVRAGAVAVVGTDAAALADAGVPAFVAEHARRAMGLLSDAFLGRPSRSLLLTGVTGTNGKTTTVHLIERIWAGLGERTGRIGTLGVLIGDAGEEAANTTPEGPDVHGALRRMVDAGVTRAAMEISSHALDQERVAGLFVPVAVFTNLTQDHLDYHGDMPTYLAAKRRLFTEYEPRDGWAVINGDDPYGPALAGDSGRRILTYGTTGQADLRASDIAATASGIAFTLTWQGKSTKAALLLPGLFNVYNAMAALGAVVAAGAPLEPALEALRNVKGAPGRFESVDEGQAFAVLVDYAHTPDALENVLRAARQVTRNGRVLAVFGCGGDRDRTKRPLMGRIASEGADLAFVTSDNPRTEDPEAIIAEIVAGMSGAGNYAVIPDRRAAIWDAIAEARDGDTVVIAGKGHEDYQIVGSEKRHFDDREVAREALLARKDAR